MTLITWENEGGTGWVKNFAKTGIPKELDVISLDVMLLLLLLRLLLRLLLPLLTLLLQDYYMGSTPQTEATGHRAFYEKSIYPLLKPHQTVFLVPGAFATRTQGGATPGRYAKGNATFCYGGTFGGCDKYMAEQVKNL